MAKRQQRIITRRNILRGMRWAPLLFLPSPLELSGLATIFENSPQSAKARATDLRFTPHYPAKSSLDDLLRLVPPGADEYVTEKYAAEIGARLTEWSVALKAAPPALDVLARFVHSAIAANSLNPTEQRSVRSDHGIEVVRRGFRGTISGREQFLQQMKAYFAGIPQIETAEFEIIRIEGSKNSSPVFPVDIRYDLVAKRKDNSCEQRTGLWRTHWEQSQATGWRVVKWEFTNETLSSLAGPVFIDISAHVLSQADSYGAQLLHGTDHWRTVLDGACGIDVYGNNGLAVG